MKKGYISLAFICTTTSLLVRNISFIGFFDKYLFADNDQRQNITKIPSLKTNLNAEAKLALGQKLLLSKVTHADLILIPHISDTMAKNILGRRESILEKSVEQLGYDIGDEDSIKQRCKLLEMVKGIGEKKIGDICKYLEVK